jgi:regulator of replication initiation timing
MQQETITVFHRVGELDKRIDCLKDRIKAHNEPIHNQIKDLMKEKARLKLEDGNQILDLELLGEGVKVPSR